MICKRHTLLLPRMHLRSYAWLAREFRLPECIEGHCEVRYKSQFIEQKTRWMTIGSSVGYL